MELHPPVHPEEMIPPGEAADIEEIERISLAILDKNRRPVRRGQHPKPHGCVRARFVVEGNLPDVLRVGVFSEPTEYPAWIRFSNGSQDDDALGDIHGMAIKLMGVGGPKLLASERDAETQDFILMDHPAFFACDARSNRALAEVIEESLRISPLRFLSPWLDLRRRRAAYIALRQYVLGRRFRELRVLRTALSKRPTSPLRITYWSATPYALGERAVKYSARPDPESLAAVSKPTDMTSPDRLRAAMEAHLDHMAARFDFLVQLRDPEKASKLPVEDAASEWSEHDAPFHKVATIEIPRQSFDTQEQRWFGENLSFTPWHALPAHQPIGGINRARKVVYESLSAKRHHCNGTRRIEPRPDDPPRWPPSRAAELRPGASPDLENVPEPNP